MMFSPAAGSHTSGTFRKEKGVRKRFASQVVLIPHSWNYWLRLQIVFHTEREEAMWAVLSCLINKSLLIFILATCAAWLPTWLCDHSAVCLFILHLEAAYHVHYGRVCSGNFPSLTNTVCCMYCRNHLRSKNVDFPSNQVLSESSADEKVTMSHFTN